MRFCTWRLSGCPSVLGWGGQGKKTGGTPAVAAASTHHHRPHVQLKRQMMHKRSVDNETPARDHEFHLLSHHVSHTEIGKKKRNAPDVADPVLSGLMSRSDTGRMFVVL